MQELQVLQNKALKNLRSLPRLYSSHMLYSNDMLITVFKITKGLIKYNNNVIFASQIHHHNTRNAASSIYVGTSRTNIGQSSFSKMGFEEFNKIVRLHPNPSLLDINDLEHFKRSIKEIIYDDYMRRFP
jgi:hypothetical protein